MMWMTCTCLKCFTIPQIFHIQINTIQTHRSRRGHDRMAVGFTITYAISAYNVCTQPFSEDQCLYDNELHTIGETTTKTNDVCRQCTCYGNGGRSVI
jgi:hypothetical protein